MDRRALTQVGRALAQLGVEHIAAYSPPLATPTCFAGREPWLAPPEARGRSERAFRTLQSLPREGRGPPAQGSCLAGITTIEAANTYLRDVYIPQHNARFAAPAEQPGSAFVPLSGFDLAEVLCHQKERKAGNDNTVVFRRNRLQIPPSPLRAHYVRATVKVRRYGDGSHAIFHGPRCIGRYDDRGIPADRAAQNVA